MSLWGRLDGFPLGFGETFWIHSYDAGRRSMSVNENEHASVLRASQQYIPNGGMTEFLIQIMIVGLVRGNRNQMDMGVTERSW